MGILRAIAALLVFTVAAVSCPVCRTETGEAVRSGIFNGDFGYNLLVTIAPFVVFFGIAAVVHFGGAKGGSK